MRNNKRVRNLTGNIKRHFPASYIESLVGLCASVNPTLSTRNFLHAFSQPSLREWSQKMKSTIRPWISESLFSNPIVFINLYIRDGKLEFLFISSSFFVNKSEKYSFLEGTEIVYVNIKRREENILLTRVLYMFSTWASYLLYVLLLELRDRREALESADFPHYESSSWVWEKLPLSGFR